MSAGDDGDRPVTAAELAAVTTALEEIRQGQQELRDATTERERKEAKGDIADATDDLDEIARRLGIPRAQLDDSISAAKRSTRKEELRPILTELLDEIEAAKNEPKHDDDGNLLDADGNPIEDKDGNPIEPKAKTEPPKKDAPAKPKQDPPAGDTEPERPHWMERKIGDLVK